MRIITSTWTLTFMFSKSASHAFPWKGWIEERLVNHHINIGLSQNMNSSKYSVDRLNRLPQRFQPRNWILIAAFLLTSYESYHVSHLSHYWLQIGSMRVVWMVFDLKTGYIIGFIAVLFVRKENFRFQCYLESVNRL